MLFQPALGTFFLCNSLLLLYFRPVFGDLKNLWMFLSSLVPFYFFWLDIIPLKKTFLKEIPLFQAVSGELCFIAVRTHHHTVESQLDDVNRGPFSKLY